MYEGTSTTMGSQPCKCCGGTGIQTNKDGINIICPCCGGTGKWGINQPSVICENNNPQGAPY